MDKLTVHIADCPIYSYKLTAEGIHRYRERALKEAKDLYLSLYEEVYKRLMSNDFNPLWTPDTKSVNDLDFKDDFGRVSYFYFNACLLRILSSEYDLKIVDSTTSEFTDQIDIYNIVRENNLELNTPKNDSTFNKQRVKKFIYEIIQSAKRFPYSAAEKIDELKNILSLKRKSILTRSEGKIIYLYVHSVGGMRLKDYLNWRYSELLDVLNKQNYKILVVSTIDFEDSDTIGYPFININRLVSKFDLFRSFLKSNLVRLKVIGFKIWKSIHPNLSTEEKYFLKNLPLHFFYPIRELYGLEHLFKKMGSGLLIFKGPVNNKGASSLIYKARKHRVRILIIAPRILTSTRFSNQYIRAHRQDQYPSIYPHSMIVYDRISNKTIKNQLSEIQLYPVTMEEDQQAALSTEKHSPFTVTLILQKRKEIKEMVEEVVDAIQEMEGVLLLLKMHPTFPIPDYLIKRYRQLPAVRILPKETSLEETLKNSDACITSYSTAAFEFAKAGKPIIWLRNVTSNSLFFAELQNQVGLNVDHSLQLREILKKMRDDSEYYLEECRKQHKQIHRLLYQPEGDDTYSLNEVISKELEKH